MLRHLRGALTLACGVAQAFAGPARRPTIAAAAPMRFDGGARDRRTFAGRTAASGFPRSAISPLIPRASSRRLRKDPNVHGAVLALDSDGGSVLGTLALGRAIRTLDMVTTIGKTVTLPDPERRAPRRARA